MYQLVLIYSVTMVTYCILLIKVVNLQIFRIRILKQNCELTIFHGIREMYSFEMKFQELLLCIF